MDFATRVLWSQAREAAMPVEAPVITPIITPTPTVPYVPRPGVLSPDRLCPGQKEDVTRIIEDD